MCSLSDDPTEPHPANQRILLNLRITADILDILRKPIDLNHKDKYAGEIEARKKCFNFIRLYCRKNKVIQGRIFEMIDELLEVEGAPRELGNASFPVYPKKPLLNRFNNNILQNSCFPGLMLASVFDGNEGLAMKLSEKQVKKMVVLLATHRVHELWVALNGIAKIGSFPIKRNQNFVIQVLSSLSFPPNPKKLTFPFLPFFLSFSSF